MGAEAEARSESRHPEGGSLSLTWFGRCSMLKDCFTSRYAQVDSRGGCRCVWIFTIEKEPRESNRGPISIVFRRWLWFACGCVAAPQDITGICSVTAPEDITGTRSAATPQDVTTPEDVGAPQNIGTPHCISATPKRAAAARHGRGRCAYNELRSSPHGGVRPGGRLVPDCRRAIVEIDVA